MERPANDLSTSEFLSWATKVAEEYVRQFAPLIDHADPNVARLAQGAVARARLMISEFESLGRLGLGTEADTGAPAEPTENS